MKKASVWDDLCIWLYVKNVKFIWWLEGVADKIVGDRNLNGK